MQDIYVVGFVDYNDSGAYPESLLGGMGGWFSDGDRWEDYLSQYVSDVHPQLESLRQAILVHRIRCTGYDHQHEDTPTCPLFSDGTVATYSFRAWGDLMAAVWSSQENKDYSYMDFYC